MTPTAGRAPRYELLYTGAPRRVRAHSPVRQMLPVLWPCVQNSCMYVTRAMPRAGRRSPHPPELSRSWSRPHSSKTVELCRLVPSRARVCGPLRRAIERVRRRLLPRRRDRAGTHALVHQTPAFSFARAPVQRHVRPRRDARRPARSPALIALPWCASSWTTCARARSCSGPPSSCAHAQTVHST